jgi:putative transposase
VKRSETHGKIRQNDAPRSGATKRMPNSYTQILYHIVFSTKDRERVLDVRRREELFRYVWGINKNLNCHLHRINGVEDHLHILTAIHPSVCLADYLKEVKPAPAGGSRVKEFSSSFAAGRMVTAPLPCPIGNVRW